MPYPIKNARYTVLVPYLDADGDPTDPTTPDTEVSQDGGAYADAAEEMSTITGSNGSGYITLTGAEMNNSAVFVAAKVASGPKATLATLYPRNLPILESGTAGAGAAGTITLASGTYTGLNLAGCFIRTTGGTGGGGTGGASNQARRISSYNTSTRVATVTPNWETTPDNTTTYDVLLPEGVLVPMITALAPATLARTLVVDASGLADANMVKVGPTGSGTAQTAGDLYSKVSGLTYTVANQVDANVKSNAGTAITSASGIQEVKVASLAAAALTSIAAAVWDALTSGMSTVGSIGKKLADWVVGTIDTYTGNTKQTGDVYARLGAPAGASVSADIAAVKSDSAAILDDTGTSGVVVAAASKTGYRLSATGVDDILDEVVQGTATVRQLLGWMGASTQGVSSGYGTGTVTFYYNDGTTAALIVTISAGNRTAITRA